MPWRPVGLAALFLALAAHPARAAFPDTSYEFGAGTRVEYRLVHPMHRVLGASSTLEGRVAVKGDRLATPLRLKLPLLTLDSGNRNRDGNALLALEANRFPKAVLEVVRFDEQARTPGPGGTVTVSGVAAGTLKLHGVAREVRFPLKAVASTAGLTVEAEFDVSLTGHGIERPALLTVPVEDAVHVTVRAVGLAAPERRSALPGRPPGPGPAM